MASFCPASHLLWVFHWRTKRNLKQKKRSDKVQRKKTEVAGNRGFSPQRRQQTSRHLHTGEWLHQFYLRHRCRYSADLYPTRAVLYAWWKVSSSHIKHSPHIHQVFKDAEMCKQPSAQRSSLCGQRDQACGHVLQPTGALPSDNRQKQLIQK